MMIFFCVLKDDSINVFYYFSKIWNSYTLNITYLINKSFTNNTLIKKSLKWMKTKDISTWLKTKVSIRMQILEQLSLLALTGIHRLLMKLLQYLDQNLCAKNYIRTKICFFGSFPTHNDMLHSNFNLELHLLTIYNSQDHKIKHIMKKNVTCMWYNNSLLLFSSPNDM